MSRCLFRGCRCCSIATNGDYDRSRLFFWIVAIFLNIPFVGFNLIYNLLSGPEYEYSTKTAAYPDMKSLAILKRHVAMLRCTDKLFVTSIIKIRFGRLQRVSLSITEMNVEN